MLAISARHVSKKFRLFLSPKDRLIEALHPLRKQYHREFWALRDVSLDIHSGETVGILGRNGSGKSTLLQIMCSVMQPTQGDVVVHGRIAALLELGAGFNPEFTGRENVMLNGAIMGLSRKEILRRMSDIEAFADIGRFFDQPVKTYSSGMFVRVAFASAIHVDPDILVVDEALAVGDAKFQRKCVLQIEAIRAKGTSVIFVSHSIETITSLCSRAVILDNGMLVADGNPKIIAEKYLGMLFAESPESRDSTKMSLAAHSSTPRTGETLELQDDPVFSLVPGPQSLSGRFGYNRHELRTWNGEGTIVDYLVLANGHSPEGHIASGTAMTIFVKVHFQSHVAQPIVGFELKTDMGVTISSSNTFLTQTLMKPAEEGQTRLYKIDFGTPLNAGDYFIDLGLAKYDGTPGGAILDVRRSIIHLIVTPMTEKRFNGIVDIGFTFTEISH